MRDSCDPGLGESYGIGKGQRVIANAIHDVSIPPKRWGRPSEADSMGVQILFSDAQTHFSEYRGECSNAATVGLGFGLAVARL